MRFAFKKLEPNFRACNGIDKLVSHKISIKKKTQNKMFDYLYNDICSRETSLL